MYILHIVNTKVEHTGRSEKLINMEFVTGIATDDTMDMHMCPRIGMKHVENLSRTRVPMERLKERGLLERCHLIGTR